MVEPGSNTSVTARLRHCEGLKFRKLLGLNDGQLAIANTPMVFGSITTTAPDRALFSFTPRASAV